MAFQFWRKKQVPRWQRWEILAQDRKFRAIRIIFGICAFALIVTGVVAGRRILIERELAQRPTLVNSQVPALSGPLTCDLAAGLHMGQIRTFIRNVGDGQANKLIPSFSLRLVPAHEVRMADYNDVPKGNCEDRPLGSSLVIGTLGSGEETSPGLPQPEVTLPVLQSGEKVLLYGVSCAYYSANSGAEHGTCDTYRLRLPDGTLPFRCDGSQVKGVFEGTLMTSCQN